MGEDIHRGAKVASEAIRLAIVEGSFKHPELRGRLTDAPSRRTVTRVLRQLEQDGWLTRDEPNSSIWRAGERALELGDMPPRAKEQMLREPIGSG